MNSLTIFRGPQRHPFPSCSDLGRRLGFILVLLSLLATACSLGYGPRQIWSVDTETDLIVYFTTDTSNEQVERFWREVLGVPDPEGKGFGLLPGISGVTATRDVEGHDALAIEFWPTATEEERQLVLSRIEASPIVYKVLTDTVPSEVETLE